MAGYGWIPPGSSSSDDSHFWLYGENGCIPIDAVKVGVDKDQGPIYAGRATFENDLLPAKILPNHGGAFVSWGGKEHPKLTYEVLCGVRVAWVSGSRGLIPPEALCVGKTSNGEKLYMGRVLHDGTLTPGKIHPSHGVLYIPYAGMELSFTEYEVMVLLK